MENAQRDPTVLEVYLHVQTRYDSRQYFLKCSDPISLMYSNEEARQFYISHGFEQTGMIENYYKRIEPPHCFVLHKVVRDVDDSNAKSKQDA